MTPRIDPAEYALGLLDGADLAEARRLEERDPAFASEVRALVGVGARLTALEADEWESRSEKLSVHFPYLFVTMGRACLLGAMHREPAAKFIPGAPCSSECRKYAVEFRLPVPGENGAEKDLLNLGNAYYHAVPSSVAGRILGRISSSRKVDRIVVTVPSDGHGWRK